MTGQDVTTAGAGQDDDVRLELRDRLTVRDVPRWLAVAAAWACRPDPSVDNPVRAALAPEAARQAVEDWLHADAAPVTDLLRLFVPADQQRLARLVGIDVPAPSAPGAPSAPPLPSPPPPPPPSRPVAAPIVTPPPPPPPVAGASTGRVRVRRVLAGLGVALTGIVVAGRLVNIVGGLASVASDLAADADTADRNAVSATSTEAQLDVGCFRWTDDGGVDPARCSEEHDLERIAWLPPGAVHAWEVADQDEMEERAGRACAQAFEDQFAVTIGRTPLSLWWYAPMVADETTYEWGVSCLVWTTVPLVDSVRGDIAGALGDAVMITDIAAGSCVEGDLDAWVLAVLPAACDTPGAAQVLVARELPDGPYPGDDAVYIEVEDACFDALEQAGYGPDVPFDFSWPTDWDWEFVDRRLTVCLAWPGASMGPAALGLLG